MKGFGFCFDLEHGPNLTWHLFGELSLRPETLGLREADTCQGSIYHIQESAVPMAGRYNTTEVIHRLRKTLPKQCCKLHGRELWLRLHKALDDIFHCGFSHLEQAGWVLFFSDCLVKKQAPAKQRDRWFYFVYTGPPT